MNKEIRAFEDNIISFVNSSELPIEVKRLVVQNLLNLVTKKADEVILAEIRDKKGEENGIHKDDLGE